VIVGESKLKQIGTRTCAAWAPIEISSHLDVSNLLPNSWALRNTRIGSKAAQNAHGRVRAAFEQKAEQIMPTFRASSFDRVQEITLRGF
jgi:hypothetical protein